MPHLKQRRASFPALFAVTALTLGILGLCKTMPAAQARRIAAQSPKPAVAPPAQQKRCPKCKKLNKPTAIYCAFCGTKLPAAAPPVTEADRLAASAKRLLIAGEVAEAERVARDALKKNTRHATAHAVLGCALAEQGDLDVARIDLEMAVRLDPNSALALAGYGVLYTKQGKTDDAERSLKRAIALDPKDTYAPKKLQELQASIVASNPPPQDPKTPTPTDPKTPINPPDNPETPNDPTPPAAKNLLDNSDFETIDRKGQVDNWELKFGRGAETGKGGYSGEHCARLTRPGAHIAQEHANAVPGLAPGRAYRISFRARREFANAGGTGQVEISWKGEGGVALPGDPYKSPEFSPLDARWQPFAFDVPVPAEARGFRIKVTLLTTEGGRGNLLLDDISFATDTQQ